MSFYKNWQAFVCAFKKSDLGGQRASAEDDSQISRLRKGKKGKEEVFVVVGFAKSCASGKRGSAGTGRRAKKTIDVI